ncbi:flagellar basal body P-ring formation chaperone FlgA [Rhodanobacter terrae]|uniref:Flagella basal body P-ring formation protein FlgA n=1 Tax=Rhodanobacter terrae TaxID=418647 RepID=A0ABW0SUR4_9GAMM
MLWLGALCGGGATAGASAIQSLDSVQATAAQALRRQYAMPGSRIEVTAGSLDLRRQLAQCMQPLHAVVAPDARLASRMTVPVQCLQDDGWTVRVPLQVKSFRHVLVTSRPLLRGDGVSAGDVHVEERDVTRLGYGYIENLGQAGGRSLARDVTSGSVLNPGMLGGRRMVRAGDHVEMVARLDDIEVRASGVALGSGDNGARLRVRNESSGKVVDAMVSAPGVVIALP